MPSPCATLLLLTCVLSLPDGPGGTTVAVPSHPSGQSAHTWLALIMNAEGRAADRGRLTAQPSSELGDLADTSIAALRPGLDPSLKLVHTASNFAALTGDAEHDLLFGEVPGGDLDALGLRRFGPACERWHSAAWVLSTEHAWGTAWPTVGEEYQGALDGSLFSVGRDAAGALQVRFFLREPLIASALGQQPDELGLPDLDVDAFAQDPDGNVFLSFRHDELVNGDWLADDGVVCLPVEDLSYSSDGDVLAVSPGCARIVLDKARVDGLVQASGALSAAGHPIQSLTDLQALAIDPLGGRFTPVQPVPGLEDGVPHLLFNGQSLGAAVLTTRGGGQFAEVDGRPLGPWGHGLGLDLTTSGEATDDLNGLELGCSDRFQPLVMSPTTVLAEDEPLVLCLANFKPGGWAWLELQVTINPPAGFLAPAAPPGTGAAAVWPWLLTPQPAWQGPVPIDGYGRARLELSTESSGNDRLLVLAQAYEVGSGELSLPAAISRP